jgi:hypothetical protein
MLGQLLPAEPRTTVLAVLALGCSKHSAPMQPQFLRKNTDAPTVLLVDRCQAALCSAPPCQQLVDSTGSPVNESAAIICSPATGLCRTSNLDDGADCYYQGGPGACHNGSCTREL